MVMSFWAYRPPAVVREGLEAETAHDPGLWSMLAGLGLVGLCLPEEHGGSGLELLDAALMAEVAGEGAMPGPLLGHQLGSLAILLGGDHDQRARWLPALASGEAIATIAWAEPGDVWEPDHWSVEVRDGRLSGTKAHVLHGNHADVIVVGGAGSRLFVVSAPGDGVEVTSFDGIDRTRRLDTVVFDDTPVSELPEGVAAAPRVFDAGLVLLAADAFGCAHRLVRETIDYLDEREQFETKLTQFQGIKHELANMVTGLEPTRALWWYAAHALDHIPTAASRVAAMAHAHITDCSMAIARACVDLHGAMGYTWESNVHLWYKRIMFDRAFLGGPDRQRDRAASMGEW